MFQNYIIFLVYQISVASKVCIQRQNTVQKRSSHTLTVQVTTESEIKFKVVSLCPLAIGLTILTLYANFKNSVQVANQEKTNFGYWKMSTKYPTQT